MASIMYTRGKVLFVSALTILVILCTCYILKDAFLIAHTYVCNGLKQADLDNVENMSTPFSEDIVLIPSDEELTQMSQLEHLKFFLKYINTIQIQCRNVLRVGSLRDGGKEICVDKSYRPIEPCLVYSFGIGGKWDFDEQVVDFFGCEVHCFDHSINRQTGKRSDKIWFYQIGISDEDTILKNGRQVLTLGTIMKNLQHTNRTIDILKMDVEGTEFKAIKQMISSGALDNVKQIVVEIHFPNRVIKDDLEWRDMMTNIPLSSLRLLYEAGFRICMRDRNTYTIRTLPYFKYPLTLLYEITLIQLKYMV